jgi:deoxyribonuclease-2
MNLLQLFSKINLRNRAMKFILYSLISTVYSLSCLDATGAFIDSWTIIKAPATADNFLYASTTENLSPPSYSLNNTSQGALSKTIKQLWNADVSYILYNDEPPYSTSYNYTVGHTKGIIALDQDTGFWIQHSIPQFPVGPAEANEYLGLLHNAFTYGQNAFCVSVQAQTINQLSYLFQLNIPNIYDFFLTDEVKKTYTNITSLTQGTIRTEGICQYTPITSIKGTSYTVFAKSTQWNNDLWSGCVANVLQKNLSVESWIRGSEIGPSCSTLEVTDVKNVYFNEDFSWSEYDDHSKWATSSDGLITCHGDINRMTTQYVRGGGGICYRGNQDLLDIISSQTAC